ncbi:MAG: hypothetical protein V1880_01000 [Patescibacteria group bacterium]
MPRDPIEKSLTEYQLSLEKGEAYGRLSGLCILAEEEDIHKVLGLPDKLHTRSMKEVPNYRAAIMQLLKQCLTNEIDDNQEAAHKRKLAQEIIEGIAAIDRIEAELKRLELDEDGENDDEDKKAV